MAPTVEQLAAAIAAECREELDSAAQRIKYCLRQLSQEQVWRRPDESMNSAANLILHLCGNLRQWIVSGVGGAEDRRDRPREFSQRAAISKEDLIRRLDETLAEVNLALQHTTATELLRRRRIQSFDVTGLGAILHAVSHFRGHTQEIIHLTRCQLGETYQFAFVPATPEQGAPLEN